MIVNFRSSIKSPSSDQPHEKDFLEYRFEKSVVRDGCL